MLLPAVAAQAQSPACPCTVFGAADGPSGNAVHDAPLELGMKFVSSENGYITALRFYKQANNTGTHVGHLWTATGTQLAEIAVLRRDGLGLAGGEADRPGRDHRRHDLRRLLLLRERLLRQQRRLLLLARRVRAR